MIIDAKTGKARFSLTEPLQTQAINEAADDHAAALLHHDTQLKQQEADERRKLFWFVVVLFAEKQIILIEIKNVFLGLLLVLLLINLPKHLWFIF